MSDQPSSITLPDDLRVIYSRRTRRLTAWLLATIYGIYAGALAITQAYAQLVAGLFVGLAFMAIFICLQFALLEGGRRTRRSRYLNKYEVYACNYAYEARIDVHPDGYYYIHKPGGGADDIPTLQIDEVVSGSILQIGPCRVSFPQSFYMVNGGQAELVLLSLADVTVNTLSRGASTRVRTSPTEITTASEASTPVSSDAGH